jgi:ArsR family transcriptional regulator
MYMANYLDPISELLQVISPPARLEILLIVGAGEACVCYLESRLGYRQAYISQHLMALRQAGLIEAQREGKYIFYKLVDPKILPIIKQAAVFVNINLPEIEIASPKDQCSIVGLPEIATNPLPQDHQELTLII